MLKYNLDIEKKSSWTTVVESYVQKSLPFYCTEVGEFYAGPKFFTERDGKNCFLMAFTVDGKGEMTYENIKTTLTADSCVLIDCRNIQHYATAKDASFWNYYWIHFDGVCAPTYYNALKHGAGAIVTTLDNSMKEKFQQLLYLSDQKNFYDSLKISFYIHEILHTMTTNSIIELEKGESRQDEIFEIANFISNNLNQNLNVDELAKGAHLSKYYFIKQFKKYIGVTPYDYILQCRILKAKTLLSNTSLYISEIAFETGFASESNFSMQFKTITSMSPTTYRKEHYSINI